MNKDYEAIQEYIYQARVERSIYVAEIVTDVIVTTVNAVKRLARAFVVAASSRARNNVFTFDV